MSPRIVFFEASTHVANLLKLTLDFGRNFFQLEGCGSIWCLLHLRSGKHPAKKNRGLGRHRLWIGELGFFVGNLRGSKLGLTRFHERFEWTCGWVACYHGKARPSSSIRRHHHHKRKQQALNFELLTSIHSWTPTACNPRPGQKSKAVSLRNQAINHFSHVSVAQLEGHRPRFRPRTFKNCNQEIEFGGLGPSAKNL